MDLRLSLLCLFVTRVAVCDASCCDYCQESIAANCSHGNWTQVPRNLPSDLEILNLNDNFITELGKDDFLCVPQLRVLKLRSNGIHTIHPQTLASLKHLFRLDLGCNPLNITVLEKSVFGVLNKTSVKKLVLNRVNFTLHPDSLEGLASSKVRTIDFSRNQEICDLPAGVFSNIGSLRCLNFSYCQCRTFNPDAFRNTSLKELDLRFNWLANLNFNNTMFTLERLNVTRNTISTINSGLPGEYPSLKRLILDFNSLYMLENRIASFYPSLEHLSVDYNRISIIEDHALNSSSLGFFSMQNNFMTFDEKHRDIFRMAPALEELHLGHLDVTETLIEKMFSNLTNLRILHLHNVQHFTKITTLMFQGLTNLTNLCLHNNALRVFEGNAFMDLRALKSLDLSNNLIRFINRSTLADHLWVNLNTIGIADNPLVCSCRLFWLLEFAHDEKNKFPDIDKANCDQDEDKPVTHLKLTPQKCFNKPFRTGILINFGVCSFVYSIILVSSLVYRFRWRLKLKLFHLDNWWRMGRKRSHKNIDCSYSFDVFVCYNQEDSHWVKNVLVPQLERDSNPKFQLCLYERDWLAGHDIVHCISESIAISRKTLLIVTNAFAQCQWCHLEMTMAQHNVIDTDNDNVLLAIMEDIEPINLSPRLALLMKRRAYLEWTEDEDGQQLFWEKMKKSLSADNGSVIRSLPTDEEADAFLNKKMHF